MSQPKDTRGDGTKKPESGDLAFAQTSADTPSEVAPGPAECTPSAGPSDPSDPLIGRCLADRYRIVGRLGQGGMGTVYRARHETLDKPVAVKVIRSDLARSDLNLVRFEREAKAAASLDHEHVVDVIDYGHTEDGVAFMVMELLEGKTLDQLLALEGPLAPGRAVAIAWQIAKGLREAHGAGVIHRDLKTPNVFLIDRDGRDHVKLLDFGISKMRESNEDDVKLTSTGVVMGTPNYLSPEQAKGEKDLDHRVDLYALGVIFFEMLTGQLPFIGTNVLELAYKHISAEPEPPSRVRSDLDIPRKLDEIVLRCLAKERGDRYQSAPEFIQALPDPATLSGGWTLISHLPGISGELSLGLAGHIGFRRWVTLALFLGALVGGSTVAFYLFRHPPPPDPADPLDGPPTVAASVSDSTTDVGTNGIDAALAKGPDTGVTLRPSSDGGHRRDGEDADASGKVLLQILPHPAHATVFLDSKRLGTGYQEVEVDRQAVEVRLLVKAAGYQPLTRPLVPDRNLAVTVELERLVPGAAKSPTQPPGDQGEPRPPAKVAPVGVKANPYGS